MNVFDILYYDGNIMMISGVPLGGQDRKFTGPISSQVAIEYAKTTHTHPGPGRCSANRERSCDGRARMRVLLAWILGCHPAGRAMRREEDDDDDD
jgi:hypothetical protein